MPRCVACLLAAVLAVSLFPAPASAETPNVRLMRVPEGGIQPNALLGSDGAVHLFYYLGHPMQGDVFYVKSLDEGRTFSEPIRVNSQPGSATISLSVDLGLNDRLHVVWNGSPAAEPKAPHDMPPLLYTRLADDGAGFEPQRNVIHSYSHIDGGSAVSADDRGNVYVTWHAPEKGGQGEPDRRIWVARSVDDGATFETETNALPQPTGACACCSVQSMTDSSGTLRVLYRSAEDVMNRDMHLLTSSDRGRTFSNVKLDEWKIGSCMMSSSSMTEQRGALYAAWETKMQVYFGRVDAETGTVARPIAPPDKGQMRKHPRLVAGADGVMLLIWTEGMFWGRGGTLFWQLFDAEGNPLLETNGTAKGIPAFSAVTAFATDDGFTIVY